MRAMLATLALGLCLGPSAWAQMSQSGMDHGDMPMEADEMPMDAEDMPHMVGADAVVNSFGDGTVNVTHGPIPEIGWPAMTMDMPLMEGFTVPEGIEPGDHVRMMLGQDGEGMYGIGGLDPAE
ncbi:copper-binding protein [Poseidonocella sp. HB161398]|uniref:copper-binding protein n=1 Tax=Poseidonocella sp. HB161398 TaxID=2320855 RepID=UPI001109AEDE|nr:copper-binding protein [Poseidonocella sp. HB161398]